MTLHSATTPGSDAPKHFVYLTLGIVSYLNRTYPLAREAIRRGHRFTFVSHEPSAIERIEEQGYDAVLLAREAAAWAATVPAPYWPRGDRVLGHLPGVSTGPRKAAIDTWRARRAAMLDSTELLDTLASLRPDLVVTELEQHRDIRVLLGAQVPLACIDDLYGVHPAPDAPHAGSNVIAKATPLSRILARFSWEQLYLKARVTRIAEAWWLAGNDKASTLTELAQREGIPADKISHQSYVFHSYSDVPLIKPLAEELMFDTDSREGIITAPVVDTERVPASVDDRFPEVWNRLVSVDQAGRRPLVYMSLGSLLEDQDRLVGGVIAAVADRPDIDLVAAIGADLATWLKEDLPPNVHLFSWVPQLDVLREADVMISPGGVASVHEALVAGVPQLFISGRGIGQNGLIARAVAHGFGQRVHPRRLSKQRVGDALDSVLADQAMRDRVRSTGSAIRARNGVARTIDAFQQLATDTRPWVGPRR